MRDALLVGGADVRHVQRLLGHRSIETTSFYTKVGVRERQAALRKAHPRERCRHREANQSFKRAACVGCGMCAHMCPRGVLKLEIRPDRTNAGAPIRVFAVDL